MYHILSCFDKLYDKFNDKEKKQFLNAFIERVDIYPERQENGGILKHIKFKFPVYYEGEMCSDFSWDEKSHVKCVVLMSRADK